MRLPSSTLALMRSTFSYSIWSRWAHRLWEGSRRGPKNLRQCATSAYDPNSWAGSVWNLGCKQISCLCRNDLIQQAYDSIKKAVIADCGKGSDTDIVQTTKIYNNYCSAGGFDIPGYSYISLLWPFHFPQTRARETHPSQQARLQILLSQDQQRHLLQRQIPE